MSENQCSTNKDKIRSEMKRRRKELSRKEIEKRSAAVFEALKKSELLGNNVCVYMDAFSEVRTLPIISFCLESKKNVYVPVVCGKDIFLCRYSEKTEKGAFGISEPVEKSYICKEKIDTFLVPGIAFDRKGSRIGFGKGYYDRLLKNTNGIKVGLMYDFQLCSEIKSEEHDIKMNYLVTEGLVIDCAV